MRENTDQKNLHTQTIFKKWKLYSSWKYEHWEIQSYQNEPKQEVGDDLSVCMLNLLPKVSTLPRLVTINLVKVEI